MSISHEVRAVIRAHGDVQRAGYRFVVQDLARRMGVKGCVRNLPDGSVEIVAEASEETLGRFVEAVKLTEPPIDVVRLDVAYGEATGEYEHFSLVPGDLAEELVEGFGTGLKYINLSREEARQGFQRVEKSIISTREDLKGSIVDMHKDLKGSIVDMHKDLKEGVTAMHGDMNKNFVEMAERYDAVSSELVRTREELTRAVDRLSALVEEFVKRRKRKS